jgi:DNA-binding beta-propeller fold protein YncE
MRRSRPISPAAFTGNRLAPVLALIAAFLVVASTASVASAATFVKDWHAPSPQGIAVGGGHVYVATRDYLKAFTTGGDFRWEHSENHACSVAFQHSDGHLFVGTCGTAPLGHGTDGIWETDARGHSAGSLQGLGLYNGWSNIQAVAAHAKLVYFSEQKQYNVIETGWPNGPWGHFSAFDPAPGLALTANRVYVIQRDRVYICPTTHGDPEPVNSCSGPSPTFGSGPGSANGQFNKPQGIAVGGLHGNVYVADTGNNRIEEFTHNGTFVNAWTGPGPGGGNFNAPMDVGVDPSGHVYVADTGHSRIVKFTP